MAFKDEDLDCLYSALSHETRRSMIEYLGEKGVLSFTALMEKSDVRDTGTFGFHLKRIEPLLEKLSDGRYRLTPLGQAAYRILKFTRMSEKYQKESLQPSEESEELEVDAELYPEGTCVIGNLTKLLLDRERLVRYNSVVIANCARVIIDKDVDPETFKSKVLGFRNTARIFTPRNLYKLVLSRLEEGVADVESYDGEPPLEK